MHYDSERAQELSRQIKGKIKTAGIRITAVNAQLKELNKPIIGISFWTHYKRAATSHLDEKRDDVWSDDDPRLSEILRFAGYYLNLLINAKYECT